MSTQFTTQVAPEPFPVFDEEPTKPKKKVRWDRVIVIGAMLFIATIFSLFPALGIGAVTSENPTVVQLGAWVCGALALFGGLLFGYFYIKVLFVGLRWGSLHSNLLRGFTGGILAGAFGFLTGLTSIRVVFSLPEVKQLFEQGGDLKFPLILLLAGWGLGLAGSLGFGLYKLIGNNWEARRMR